MADHPTSSKLAIHVVGCNHGIQIDPNGDWAALDNANRQNQRKCFVALLEDIVKQKKIEFIGEEWGGGEQTSAETLGAKYKITVRNINSSKADNAKMGIPENYLTGSYSDEQKQNRHRLREQFMHQKVAEYRGNARDLLVICGFDHFDALAGLLAKDGDVEQIDYRKMQWYRPGVFPE